MNKENKKMASGRGQLTREDEASVDGRVDEGGKSKRRYHAGVPMR
jgi:hypothetical protein